MDETLDSREDCDLSEKGQGTRSALSQSTVTSVAAQQRARTGQAGAKPDRVGLLCAEARTVRLWIVHVASHPPDPQDNDYARHDNQGSA